MNDKFNVLLYFDDSQQAFNAAVYTAKLFKNMPNMHLTVLHAQEGCEDSEITEYSWLDTKDLVNWALVKSNQEGTERRWPISATSDCMKGILDGSHCSVKNKYYEIISEANDVFIQKEQSISHVKIYSNPSISDILEALYNYAANNAYNLIIMGTQGLTTLKVSLLGLVNSSHIPLMLIKRLPHGCLTN